jgi:hypothetical protein
VPSREEVIASLAAAYGGEAIFRPSSADRFIGCPGSVKLAAGAPRERQWSPWIVEGLAAHKVAEQALKGERQLDEWSDRMVRVDDGGLYGAFCDEEMMIGLGLYLETIYSDQNTRTETFTEHRMSLSVLDPGDPLFAQNRGTADRVHIHRHERKIRIFDLKWGRGVMVSPTSPQPKNYALLAMMNFDVEGGWREIEQTIVQPRATDPGQRVKTITYSAEEILTTFMGQMVESMEAALGDNPPLNPGARCRWCPAKAICPALRDQALNLAAAPDAGGIKRQGDLLGPIPSHVVLGTIEDPRPVVPPGGVSLPSPVDLAPEEISAILARRHLWDTWITAVQHRAVSLLEAGATIPGWKLGRRTKRRRWKDTEDVATKLREMGLKISDLYTEPKLRSPRQIEMLLEPSKRGLVAPLVERPLGDLLLMPADSIKAAIPPSLGPISEDEED